MLNNHRCDSIAQQDQVHIVLQRHQGQNVIQVPHDIQIILLQFDISFVIFVPSGQESLPIDLARHIVQYNSHSTVFVFFEQLQPLLLQTIHWLARCRIVREQWRQSEGTALHIKDYMESNQQN